MVADTQLISFINTIRYDEELMKKAKELFYQEKIQEAKNKKGVVPAFKWDELPEEIEEKIILFKQDIDYDYIKQVVKKNNITIKSVKEYLFKEYQNENDEHIKGIIERQSRWDLQKFIWTMINKECWKNYYGKHWEIYISNRSKTLENWNKITENCTPSLEMLIIYRNKERKQQSIDRAEKNKVKESIVDSKFKVGDLIYDSECIDYNTEEFRGVYNNAYIITGETKTQFRVDRIRWNKKERSIDYHNNNYWYGLSKDKTLWDRVKNKNIGKKSYIEKLDNNYKKDNSPINYDDYYVTSKWFGGD